MREWRCVPQLLIAALCVLGCDPPYMYMPERNIAVRVFPGVTATAHGAAALIGSWYFSPPLSVDNQTDEPVIIVGAKVTAHDGTVYESSDRVHAVYRTCPAREKTQISTSWSWDGAAVRALGRTCTVQFLLENGGRQAEMTVTYRRTR